MAQDSPQAVIPSRRTLGHFLKGAIDARDLAVDTPRIVAANDGVAIDAFDSEDNVGFRYLQNCCAFPVKYAIDTDAAAESFHGILAACVATDDGLGSGVDLSKFKGRISVMAIGGALRIATIIGYTPERLAQ